MSKTKLRDNLLVVIPDYVRKDSKGEYGETETVTELRTYLANYVDDMFGGRLRAQYPRIFRFLSNFETDPETVIELPNGLGGRRLKVKLLRVDRVVREAGHQFSPVWNHLLDTFEVECEEPMVVAAGEMPPIPPMPREFITEENARRLNGIADHAHCVKNALYMFDTGRGEGLTLGWLRALYEQDYREKQKATDLSSAQKALAEAPSGRVHRLTQPKTRLERVAAGLEKDPYKVVYDNDLSDFATGPAPEFRLRPYRQTLTLEFDDPSGEDVALPLSSDGYFGVKR